jgi:hypothetical protein
MKRISVCDLAWLENIRAQNRAAYRLFGSVKKRLFAEQNTITLLPLLPSVQNFFATFCRGGSAGATRRARNRVIVFTSISVRRAGAQEP